MSYELRATATTDNPRDGCVMGAPSKLRLGGDFYPPDFTTLHEQDDLFRVLCAAFAIFAVKVFWSVPRSTFVRTRLSLKETKGPWSKKRKGSASPAEPEPESH
jgi:hypothetical protein